jgi:Domain of unknown function (DUF4365)
MTSQLQEITGSRGEAITELALTDFSAFTRPLFRPGFLGDKWPSIDSYVELNSVRGKRPYFFVQTKATRSQITAQSTNLNVTTKKKDIQQLLRIPGPTYIIGVHEPSKRTFIRSVHAGLPKQAITRISLSHELTSANLRILHTEVKDFWKNSAHKPTASHFS